ncbi:ATP-binding protein [candidate division WOR-3 bacterium]|nr:ATP-binding protein [candidate division WOR-3 bacterium]
MKNVEVEFGEYLTVISGLNGTGKSSVLGLAGHIFSFREGPQKFEYKTLSNKPFETEYSEIFKFCPKHDLNKVYEYTAYVIDDNGNEIIKSAKSRYVKAENRFRIDVGKRTEEKEGKIHHPVIYLGLRRLYPIAEERDEDIVVDDVPLEKGDITFYKRESDEVFVSLDKTISPQHVKTKHKDFFAIETHNYSTFGNSAGQDNLGQILTAILSFKKLNPPRGLLLIDELDTALFAGAQINLIKRFYGYARRYNLQIVFTTHSLKIAEFLLNSEYDGVRINFLEIRNGKVINTIQPDFSYIKSRILREIKEKATIEKINLLCEDHVSSVWCKNILNGTDLKKLVQVYAAEMSSGSLVKFAARKLPCLKKFVFILDGDARNKPELKKLKNVIFLPEDRPPETVFYKFLKDLSDDDKFWGGERIFYKDTCFRDYPNRKTLTDHKKWFKSNETNFGRGCSNLLNRWKEDKKNIKSRDIFIRDLQRAIKNIK